MSDLSYNVGMDSDSSDESGGDRSRLKQTFTGWFENSRSTIFFGGAGVSVASGIPDFRSNHGIYAADESAETMLSIDYMLREPARFWPFYRRIFMAPNNGPNAVHIALAQMEQAGSLSAVITQNIDGLHQQAGSRKVLELHGTGQSFSCLACLALYTFAEVLQMAEVPRCPACGGRLRPDIVLYGEGLDENVVDESLRLIRYADLILVAGTSLVVYPAAGFLSAKRADAKLVIMNRQPTAYDRTADLCLAGDLVETFAWLGLSANG